MTDRFSFGNLSFELTPGRKPSPGARPSGEGEFRILVMGDFSGRGGRGVVEPLGGRKPLRVDVDNVEDVLSGFNAEVQLPGDGDGGGKVAVQFRTLDDFHPDRLLDRLDLFAGPRDLRARLKNRTTFDAAAEEVRAWAGEKPKEEPPAPAPKVEEAAGGDLLSQLLGKKIVPPSVPAARRRSVDIDALLRDAVKDSIVPEAPPDQAALVAAVEKAMGVRMRAVLHHPDFQAVEAAWRGLHLLVSGLETDEDLKLYVMDASRAELEADLATAGDMEGTALYKTLVEKTVRTPGAVPWALLAGFYTFDRTAADAALLGRIARIARQAGAPFVAAGGASLVGCPSFADKPDPDDWKLPPPEGAAEAWTRMRSSGDAPYLGLAAPRLLLRLPYGAKTDRVESFAFEEDPDHRPDALLWGSPAAGVALLLGQTFLQSGWEFDSESVLDIDSMPYYVYTSEGDKVVCPCAEVLLTERAVAALFSAGLMPLISIKNRDSVRLGGFWSIADPPAQLAGRWI